MSREKDPECRGLLLAETENAIKVCPANANTPEKHFWIPKSQIGYRRTDKPLDERGATHVVFTIPEWLIETQQCWELVP